MSSTLLNKQLILFYMFFELAYINNPVLLYGKNSSVFKFYYIFFIFFFNKTKKVVDTPVTLNIHGLEVAVILYRLLS